MALPLITLVMHCRGLSHDDATALLLARRWSAVMAVQFAVGVVTGTVLSFEFGLLWPGLMGRWGDVFGIGFGVEAWAFFLEAVLIAIYLYGWRRLGTEATADVWSNPTSIVFGLLAIAATAFLGAVFLTGDARRFDAPDLVGYFRLRALAALAVLVALAVITFFVTHEDAPHVWHGLTHGVGLVFVVVAGAATIASAWLLLRTPGNWARVTAVGVVASAVIAWGMAQRPYLIPTSLTVADGAGAPATLTWLAIVTLVALVIVVPAVVFLYWLDTHGELESLTDADLRRSGAEGDGTTGNH